MKDERCGIGSFVWMFALLSLVSCLLFKSYLGPSIELSEPPMERCRVETSTADGMAAQR